MLAEIEKMSVDEKIQLIDDLWESLASKPDQMPITEEQRQLLRARREAYRQNPVPGKTWAEVRASIETGE